MEIADWVDILVRLIAATLLCALIGLEREIRNKPAGLRTHMLVGLGAAAFCVFSLDLVHGLSDQAQVSLDPNRIIQGVIGGIGFLGAGAIIQSRGDVYGMTTAAGIWISGAIGVGCGIGDYFAATIVTLVSIGCLIPVRLLEHFLDIRNPNAADKQTRKKNRKEKYE